MRINYQRPLASLWQRILSFLYFFQPIRYKGDLAANQPDIVHTSEYKQPQYSWYSAGYQKAAW